MAKAGASKGRQTQWAAQFMAAAELVRRGYTVTFTMGNGTPDADLMIASPEGNLFLVDVKGLSSKSDWLVRPKDPRAGLFYMLVYLAPLAEKRAPDRFFILTQEETNALEQTYREARPGNKTTMPGFRFNEALHYEGKWNNLPA